MGRGLAALAIAAPGMAHADSLELFYERSVMTAADARCGLFAEPIAAALAASRAQARGAAMRAGTDPAALTATDQRAQQAAARVACDSSDMLTAANRVRTAFEGYAKISRMSYPGDVAEWRADRSRTKTARWRLSQTTTFGQDQMVFGLVGQTDAVMAVARFEDGAAPYAARLLMRDQAQTNRAYLNVRDGDSRHAGRRPPLARRLPPESAQMSYTAQARSRAGRDLLPKDMASGWAFRFSPIAAQALARLDPREAVAVEFLFADDTTRRAYVEVGDFSAGRAFLQIASR